MTSIVVVLPRLEDARGIRNLLVKNGFRVHAVCTTGAQAVSSLENLNGGVVICGYRLTDMMYSELQECLPEGFELLLLASRQHLAECDTGSLNCLAMPLKVHELLEATGEAVARCERKKRLRREKPKERTPEERELIAKAKKLLMEKKGFTELQAHRYLQKCSMDSGTNIVEMAQMVLTLEK